MNAVAHNARYEVIANAARKMQRIAEDEAVQIECYAMDEVADALTYVAHDEEE